MRKSIKTLSVILSLSVGVPCVSHATFGNNEVLEKRDELKREEQNLEGKLKLLKDNQEEKERYVEELSNQILNFEKQIDLSNQEIFRNEQRLLDVEKQIKDTEDDIKHLFDVLKERIRTLELTGDLTAMDVLFDSCDFSDLFEKIDIIGKFSASTESLVERLKKQQEEIKKDKEEIECTKVKEEEEKVHIEEKKEKMRRLEESNKEDLEIIRKKKEEALKQKEDQRIKTVEHIAKMYKEGSATKRESYAKMRDESRYIWPTTSMTVTQEFSSSHHGIDVVGFYGDSIFVVSDGVVKEANSTNSYGRGWGYYVLVDHGEGYTTRYAHLSSVGVSVGQKVNAGQQIGAMGSTGRSTCNHLHFETMKDGSCYDPRTEL